MKFTEQQKATLQHNIGIASERVADAQAKLRELKEIEYLAQIAETGTVVDETRSMFDVMWLLESGWIEHDGTKYYVTDEGEEVLEGVTQS